ncbi:MAG: hypothetical protein Q9183_007452 [Haloplaca sp. 2 TL-2023]
MSQADPADAEFYEGSFDWLAGPPAWVLDTACSFYNTSKCLKPHCKFNHQPDHRSLRLVLTGPNICKDHLFGEHGCEFSTKGEGRRCYYSHDLTKAALPLHDRAALKEHLLLTEAYFNGGISYEDEIALDQAEKSMEEGSISEDTFQEKMVEIFQARQDAVIQWYDHQERAANNAFKQFCQTGKTARDDPEQSKALAFDMTGREEGLQQV